MTDGDVTKRANFKDYLGRSVIPNITVGKIPEGYSNYKKRTVKENIENYKKKEGRTYGKKVFGNKIKKNEVEYAKPAMRFKGRDGRTTLFPR